MDANNDETIKRLEDSLAAARQNIEQRYTYLSKFSHEIRTPINLIVGMIELANAFQEDKEKLADYLSKIDNTSKYLCSLTNKWVNEESLKIINEREKLEELSGYINNNIVKGQKFDCGVLEKILNVYLYTDSHLNNEEIRDPIPDLEKELEGIKDNHDIDFAGRRILVVEDNEINRDITQTMLELKNAEVEVAKDGQQAVEIFSNSSIRYFDAILMDIKMPVKNGYEATRDIRSRDREDAKTIPIIATTAVAMPEAVKEAFQSGMNAHIGKPVDTVRLYQILDSYFL